MLPNTCIVADILFSGHPYIGRHYRASLIHIQKCVFKCKINFFLLKVHVHCSVQQQMVAQSVVDHLIKNRCLIKHAVNVILIFIACNIHV